MKVIIKHTGLILLLFHFLPLFSQHPLFNHHPLNRENDQIFDVLAARDGGIYLVTQSGLYRYDGFTYTLLQKPFLKTENFTGLHSSGEQVFLYSSEGNIYRLKGEKVLDLQINKNLQETFGNRIINCLYPDRNNNLWVSTVIGGGAYKIDLDQPGSSSAKSGGKTSFFIREIEKDGFLWGANNIMPPNNKLTVDLLGKKPFEVTLSDQEGYSKTAFTALEDKSFLFAREHEILNLGDSSLLERSFIEDKIQVLFQDAEGKIWVGLYNGGVICYPTGSLASGSFINYLGNKTVTGIDQDPGGNIWIATLKDGLFEFEAGPEISYSAPQIYSSTDRDTVEEIQTPITTQQPATISKEKDERYISTEKKQNSTPPVTYINNISINNRDTSFHRRYTLPHDKNFISVSFSGLVNKAPEKLQYKYKLQGVDQKWIYTSNTTAQYTTLPPGSYEFIVYAMNDDGVWSIKPATVSFLIEPPFWRTWWFYIFSGISLLLVVIFIIAYSTRKARKKERIQAEINKQILSSELQALRSQMNPHFIFNTLSSIQHFIMNKKGESAVDYLSKFAKLIRLIMENTKKSRVPIKHELEALELYLQLEELRLDQKFVYQIIVGDNIDTQYDEIPPMLIQPYVENAIWHGISHLKGKGKIRVEIKRENHRLLCRIIDNGVGRERSMEINKGKKKHKSRGMSITRERLEMLNATQENKLSAKITDLKDAEGNPAGTKVEIFVPLD